MKFLWIKFEHNQDCILNIEESKNFIPEWPIILNEIQVIEASSYEELEQVMKQKEKSV